MEFVTKYDGIAGIPSSMGQLAIKQHSNSFTDAIVPTVPAHA
jgi:hypothetical protein